MKDFKGPWRVRLDGVWLDEEQIKTLVIENEIIDVTHEHPTATHPILKPTGRQRVRVVDGPWSDWRDPGDWFVLE